MITVYTDGACKGNGQSDNSAGGFGAFICYPDGKTQSVWGGEPATTNNRMELLGAITALQNTPTDTPVQIITDSNYVKDGITQWIANWKKNGWKTANKQPVKNLDLWQQLDALTQHRTIDWQWIKGHAGFFGNEMADTLANQGVHTSGNEWGILPNHHSNQTDNIMTNNTITDNTAPNHNNPNYTIIGSNPSDLKSLNDINAELSYLDETSNTYNNETPTKKPKKSPKAEKIPLTHNSEQNPDYDGNTKTFNSNFRPILPLPINRGIPERQLIMDTETTGKDPKNGDRIVEIGMVEMIDRKFTGERFHIYLDPEREMDDEVISVHGISNEFLTDKPYFKDAASFVREFCEGAELIAHNASFDMSFLDMEFERIGQPPLSSIVKVTDTLIIARQLFRGQRNTLDALVQRLNVGKKDRTFHGALLDSEILAEVYLAMTSGQVALNIDESDGNEVGTIVHEKFSELASLLVRSKHNQAADEAWRKNTLQS